MMPRMTRPFNVAIVSFPCVVILGLIVVPEARGDVAAVRSFQCDGYAPDHPTLVTIPVDLDTGVQVWAVEESPPSGWTVTDISHSGVYDAVNLKVKWGPFFDDQSRTLTYSVTPPSGETDDGIFSGQVAYDDANIIPTTGDSILPLDLVPPELTCPQAPDPITADEDCIALLPDLTAGASATDNCDADVIVTQNPLAGAAVGLGNTLVTLTAIDDAGNTDTCQVTVTVVDTTAPVLTCPPVPAPLTADENCTALLPDLTTEASATDNCDTIFAITQSPLPGTAVGLGDNVITLSTEDAAGNTDVCTVIVSVVNPAPVIEQGPGPLFLEVQADSQCPNIDNQVNLSATDLNHGPSELSWAVKTSPVTGTVSFIGGQVGGSVTVCYEPDSDQMASDSFIIEVNDGCGGRDEITVEIAISGIHHPADWDYNWCIVISEMSAYADAWKVGDSWDYGPVPIPMNYMIIGAWIWWNGESYLYDPASVCPNCWQLLDGGAGAGSTSARKLVSSTAKSALTVKGSGIKPLGVRSIKADQGIEGFHEVLIEVAPPAGTVVWAVEETPPVGWNIDEINENGAWDIVNGRLKWGPFFDDRARTLAYRINSTSETEGINKVFVGLVGVDDYTASIGGESKPAEPDAVRGTRSLVGLFCGAGMIEVSLGMCLMMFLWLSIRRVIHS